MFNAFAPSSSQATIQKEQKSVDVLVKDVFNAYMTANNFATISTQTVSGILNIPLNE